MKLYLEIIKLVIKKYIFRKNTGRCIKEFCQSMGIVYIKFAQILATQNIGKIFTEKDRLELSSICDNCKEISFSKIKKIIESEYKYNINNFFTSIDKKQIGSASISQVHKATLKNGNIVAVKVKRKDITNGIEKDINKIRKLMHRYGKMIGFNNLTGGDKGLELYLSWIYEETDFVNEKENIKKYSNFADSVNGKEKNTCDIKLPKVYDELCTDNIIVMEYIESKTINKLELNEENKSKINYALDSYLKLSFHALLNDKKIAFHGDPHSGNIYIDDNGNIGFLDMGLVFELSPKEAKLTRELFISAYLGDYKKICKTLFTYTNFNDDEEKSFENEVKRYCQRIKSLPLTSYFMELVIVCLSYKIVPPNFLFCMAKAFVCINGINGFSENLTTGVRLLEKQIIDMYIKESINNGYDLVLTGIEIMPKLLNNINKFGLAEGLNNQFYEVSKFRSKAEKVLNTYTQMLKLLRQTG